MRLRIVSRPGTLFPLLVFTALSCVSIGSLAATPVAGAALPLPAASRDDSDPDEPAPLVISNRTVFLFRAPILRLTPKERAENAQRRIEEIPFPPNPQGVKAEEGQVGNLIGLMITIDSRFVFGILPEDLDPQEEQTLQQAGDATVAALREALRAYVEQHSLPNILRGIGLASLATLLAAMALWGIGYAHQRMLPRLEARLGRTPMKILNMDIRGEAQVLERFLLRLFKWAVGLTIIYLWLTFVLVQFPYTRPWGEAFGAYLLKTLQGMLVGAIGWLPNLGMIALILFFSRIFTRAVGAVFEAIESGRIAVPWLHEETLRATRRLVAVVVWVFALVFCYPHIPGAQTAAFQGIAALIGLMLSLGASGVVNQAMSGLVVLYARAIRVGELVKVGETMGVVTEMGSLATRLRTLAKEEVTIPNAVLVNSTTTNYSRLAGAEGAIIPTSVTIGYDAPWRQVHAMLILAAERTPGVKKDPPPRVIQKSLSDFYVEYLLLCFTDTPEDRAMILSRLHGNIQDAFNEFGVQIMSPHFESQPSEKVWVPRSAWRAAPANADREQGAADVSVASKDGK